MSQPTPLPQSLGNRYEFGDLIGTGGMGAVYLGRDMLTGQNVAIKLLKPEIIEAEPSMVERFAREADALRQLNHPNIVKVLGTYEEEDKHFIVMEYVGGGTLADLLHQVNPLPIKQVLEISLELADALSRAHHLKIIHRDIKPANVLLAIDGTPRLTDFGVAYLETKDRMTRTGTSLGTLDYLSPEAIDGEAVDTRADIWAFGVMLYEMLAGARPFTGQSVTQMLAAILTQTPPDLKTVRPDIPESLAELVTDMLEKDRNQRTASARMVGAALEAVLRGDSTPSRSRFPTPAITPKPAPRNRLFIMVGAAAIVLLGVIGFLILNGGNGQDEATDNDIASLATPAPEATASSAITQTLPDGWIRYTQDSFSIAVPSGWTNVGSGDAMDTYFNLLAPIAGANPGMSGFVDVLRPMIENGAIRLVLSDLTNFSNVVVMAEPIGFTLTPELVRLRVEAFFSSLELLEPIEFTTVQLPAGDAQVFTGQIQMGDMIGDGAGYLFIKDSILYWVLFPFAHSDITNLETMTPLIDQIMQSFTFEEATPEATPEAAASTLITETLPDGWIRYTQDEVSVAVPPNWTNFSDAALMETMMGMFMQMAEDNPELASVLGVYGPLIENGYVKLLLGDFVAFNILTIIAEPIGMNLSPELIQIRIRELFGDSYTALGEMTTVQLPAGEAVQAIVTLDIDNLTGKSQAYFFAQNGTLYWVLFASTSAPAEFDSRMAIFEQAIQTLTIGSNVAAEATAEVTPEPTAEATPIVSADGWETITSENVQINVPPGWLDVNQPALVEAVFDMMASSGEVASQIVEVLRPQIEAGAIEILRVDPLSEGYMTVMVVDNLIASSDMLDFLQSQWIARFEAVGIANLESEIVTLGAGQMARIEFDFTLTETNSLLSSGHISFYIFSEDERIYYFQFATSNATLFDQMRPTFERIIESFRPVQ